MQWRAKFKGVRRRLGWEPCPFSLPHVSCRKGGNTALFSLGERSGVGGAGRSGGGETVVGMYGTEKNLFSIQRGVANKQKPYKALLSRGLSSSNCETRCLTRPSPRVGSRMPSVFGANMSFFELVVLAYQTLNQVTLDQQGRK